MTADHETRKRLGQLETTITDIRKDLEHLRDVAHSDEQQVTVGAVWSAFIDFRAEMRTGLAEIKEETRDGLKGVHRRQDITNGTLKRHEWQIAFASGGVAVLAFAVAVFAVYLLTRFG